MEIGCIEAYVKHPVTQNLSTTLLIQFIQWASMKNFKLLYNSSMMLGCQIHMFQICNIHMLHVFLKTVQFLIQLIQLWQESTSNWIQKKTSKPKNSWSLHIKTSSKSIHTSLRPKAKTTPVPLEQCHWAPSTWRTCHSAPPWSPARWHHAPPADPQVSGSWAGLGTGFLGDKANDAIWYTSYL